MSTEISTNRMTLNNYMDLFNPQDIATKARTERVERAASNFSRDIFGLHKHQISRSYKVFNELLRPEDIFNYIADYFNLNFLQHRSPAPNIRREFVFAHLLKAKLESLVKDTYFSLHEKIVRPAKEKIQFLKDKIWQLEWQFLRPKSQPGDIPDRPRRAIDHWKPTILRERLRGMTEADRLVFLRDYTDLRRVKVAA